LNYILTIIFNWFWSVGWNWKFIRFQQEISNRFLFLDFFLKPSHFQCQIFFQAQTTCFILSARNLG
jgi:hypothetical protein